MELTWDTHFRKKCVSVTTSVGKFEALTLEKQYKLSEEKVVGGVKRKKELEELNVT